MADLSKINVLVVEDNAHMASILRSLLFGFGVGRVLECRYATEAIDQCRKEVIDLILVDYEMPVINGLDFIRTLRKQTESLNPFVPIIMVTGHTERSHILAARDAGVTEVCAKPITANQLWTKIAAVVNHPRPFVRTRRFFGPDRRRHDLEHAGRERRAALVERSAAPCEGRPSGG